MAGSIRQTFASCRSRRRPRRPRSRTELARADPCRSRWRIRRRGACFLRGTRRRSTWRRVPGGLGGLDIWVARRPDPTLWGAPEGRAGQLGGQRLLVQRSIGTYHSFYFVSNRSAGCGGADIYMTRLRPDGWDAPENPGCDVNSAADEASPFPLPEPGKGKVLYFSSVRPGGFAADPAGAVPDSDLYMSERHDGSYGTPELVPGANTAFEDGQPNLRRDGRELFFFSNRPGTLGMAESTRRRVRRRPTVVDPCEPRPDGQQSGRRRHAAVAVVGRHDAVLRLDPCRRRRVGGPLRDHAGAGGSAVTAPMHGPGRRRWPGPATALMDTRPGPPHDHRRAAQLRSPSGRRRAWRPRDPGTAP